MGSSRYWYRQSESTDEERDAKYRWEKVGEIEGVKVLFPKDGAKGKLPAFSNTPSTMYFKKNDKGKVDQLRIFIGRHSFIDIDWGHSHKGIPNGVAHVHTWRFNKLTEKMERTKDEFRLLSKYMIKKYGKYILGANPNVQWSM